jgi:hypothetical protein
VNARTKLSAWTFLVAIAVAGCSGGGAETEAAPPDPLSPATTEAPPVTIGDLSTQTVELRPPAGEPPSPAAPTPEDAVRELVAAEAVNDAAASWGVLAGDTRAELGSVAEWQRRHAVLPHFESFEVASVETVSATEAAVRGTASMRAELDEIIGLVPASATVSWRVVAEDGGWRVAFGDTAITPQFPDDAAAPEAVRRWVDARRRCADPGDTEHGTGLVGAASLADRLCDASGEVRVGRAVALANQPDPAPVLAAFGPAADHWARTVEISGAVDVHVVVAPLGERWVVIGLLT